MSSNQINPQGFNSPQNISPYSYGSNSSYGSTGGYDFGNLFQGYGGVSQDGFSGNGYPSLSSGSMPSFGNASGMSQPLDDRTALARLQTVSSQLDLMTNPNADGEITVADLQKGLASDDPVFTPEVKQSLQYMLDNQNGTRGRVDGFDGNSDGVMEVDSINQLVVNPMAQQAQTPEQEMSNSQALMILKDHFFGQPFGPKTFDREDVIRLANDKDAPEAKRLAAQKLLKNQDLMDVFETSKQKDMSKRDGKFSLADFDAALNNSNINNIGVPPPTMGAGYSSSGMPPQMASYPPPMTGGSAASDYYNSVIAPRMYNATTMYNETMMMGQGQPQPY